MNEASDIDTGEYPGIDDLLTKHFGPSPPPVSVQFGALSHTLTGAYTVGPEAFIGHLGDSRVYQYALTGGRVAAAPSVANSKLDE